MSALAKRLAWTRLQRSARQASLRVAVLASYTAEPLAPMLGMALEAEALGAEIFISPFDQLAAQCLDDASETAAFAPHVLVAHARLEERGDGLVDLARLALAAARRWGATLVWVLPAVPEARPLGVGDAADPNGVTATAERVRAALRAELAGSPDVLLADMEAIVRALGTSAALAPALFAAARIPYADAAFERLGDQLARLIALGRRGARKVLVLDADRTLWGGAVGEDGPAGVAIGGAGAGAAHREFQAHVLKLREAGMLLALASRNTEADVWAAFERPEMLLKREHLAAWRVNWAPKSENLKAMAAELGLDVASFALIDDNPAELAEVAANCPGVACVRFPEDPAGWLEAVQAAGALDRLPPSAEDRARADHYATERERVVQQAALGPEAYLASLELTVTAFTPAPADMGRLAQLVAKTNQFNLSCKRRDAAELATLRASESHLVRLYAARDRFGDYGVVGAAIVEANGEIDTFLLSCRALGRGIEQAMLADAAAKAARRGFGPLSARLEEHPRNEPARRFFAALGALDVPTPLDMPAWPAHIRAEQPQEVAP